MDAPMGCEYECPDRHEHPGLRDCCHTCTYFFQGGCHAPKGFGFFPRILWRMTAYA
jgi:hypothetical protein